MVVRKAAVRKETTVEEGIERFVSSQAIGLRALLEMAEREALNVTEVVTQDKSQEFAPGKPSFQEVVQIESMLRSGVTVDQIVTLGATGSLPALTAPELQNALIRLVEDKGSKAIIRQVSYLYKFEFKIYMLSYFIKQAIVEEATRLAPEEPIGLKAVLRAVETKSANMEDIVVMATHPDEFDLTSEPVPEMATVSTLLNEGISCQEMLTIVKAGELPALNLPETQWPLVQIMEKLGHSATVTQVITEEPAIQMTIGRVDQLPSTAEESLEKFITNQSIGLRALLQLAVQESVDVSEVAALDKAREFLPGQPPFEEFLKVDTMLKSGVNVDQIVALGTTGNLPVLTSPESQQPLMRIVEDQGFRAIAREVMVKEAIRMAPGEPIGLKAVLRAVETKSATMNDIVVMAVHPEEFDLQSEPVPEMARVSTLILEGVSCQEMLTMIRAGELPALQLPETQWPLVQIMERLGQAAIVSQVIVEEPCLNLRDLMPEESHLESSTVESLSTATMKKSTTL